MPNNVTGNENVSSDFMRLLMALKGNIMRAIPVAEVLKVMTVNDTSIKCSYLSNQNSFVECVRLQGLSLKANDIVLAVFTKTRFKENLAKIKAGQQPQTIDGNNDIHSLNNGVIIGVIYRKEE